MQRQNCSKRKYDIFTRILLGLELDHLLAHPAVVEEEQARGGLAG